MIEIEPVDERDSGWEDQRPRFRAYLHGSAERPTPGWTATYDVTGADVVQVIAPAVPRPSLDPADFEVLDRAQPPQ